MTRLLLTGFEPFPPWPINPSWDALVLAEHIGLFDGLDVRIRRIPVRYDIAFEALDAACRDFDPDAAISFGLHGGMSGSVRDHETIYVEISARNRDGASKTDNAGVARPARPIIKGGEDRLPSTLPVAEIVTGLKRARFACESSDDAGAYLCNHLFYRGARALAGRIPYGFIHVPPVETIGGAISLERLAEAVALAANITAERIA